MDNERSLVSAWGVVGVNAAVWRFLEAVETSQPEALKMIQREGFVFDGSGGRWERLALSLYSRLVELSHEAVGILAESLHGRECWWVAIFVHPPSTPPDFPSSCSGPLRLNEDGQCVCEAHYVFENNESPPHVANSYAPGTLCDCGHTYFHHVFGTCDVSRGGVRVDTCQEFVAAGREQPKPPDDSHAKGLS